MSKAKVKIKTPTGAMAAHFISLFKSKAQVVRTKATEEAAQRLVEEAKRVIDDQEYDWVPLSPAYLEYKRRHGLDDRTYVATGYYRDHITYWKNGGKLYVGFRPYAVHKPSGLKLTRLARWLEFGTSTISARPIWRPLMSKFVRQSEALAKSFKRRPVKKLDKKVRTKK